MADVFGNFDFQLLSDPGFLEDSVREELIVPLLKALGYSASPPFRIIRSKKLEHPFVYFGTVKKDITIIPDYILEREGAYAWILDAKAPNANIDTGKNVEQAYSYAMHRDVNVPLYGLCNGQKLVIYHVSRKEPLIDVKLSELTSVWSEVLTLLGCKSAWPSGLRPDFLPDLGLALSKAGLTGNDGERTHMQMFIALPIAMITKVEEGLYTFSILIGSDLLGEEERFCLGSFDFRADLYPSFLASLDRKVADEIRSALSRQPYRMAFEPVGGPPVTFIASLGDVTHSNENESYRPFLVERFI